MKVLKNVLKYVGIVILAVVIIVAGLFGTLVVTEYKPADVESLTVSGEASDTLAKGDTFTIATWNLGFGALGDTTDFFMDGGKGVQTSSKEQVAENVAAFSDELLSLDPDFVFLQEVDVDSKRSYHTSQVDAISNALNGYQSTFAYNFKTLYLPYPWPPIGKVSSGILTLSKYPIESATRVKLPCPFGFPSRIVNLKRCLSVNRVKIEGTDKELVLINLHLEAYDDGEGKAEQTKQLKELIANEIKEGNYVIAGGDFNQCFSNIDTSAYPKIDGVAWQPGAIDTSEFDGVTFYADNRVPSCRSLDRVLADSDPNDFQYYVIDGFIVSNNLKVKSVETQNLKFKNSDHNPMVITIEIQ